MNEMGRTEKKCEYCSRVFARTEHLARHRRTHTGETPFRCGVCRRSFQRADIRATHEKSCSEALNFASSERGRKRVRRACLSCRGRKVACDGQQPCGPCRTRSQPCHHQGDKDQPVINSELAPVLSSPGLMIEGSGLSHTLPQQTADSALSVLQPDQQTQGTNLPDVNVEGLGFFSFQENTTFTHFDNNFDLHGLWSQPVEYNWLEEPEAYVPGLFGLTEQETVLTSPTSRLKTYMSDYFDSRSRQVSPSRSTRLNMLYSTPPDLRSHDSDIVKVFLELFRRHVPPVLNLYHGAASTTKHSPKYILAMAAVGGLFSVVSGSTDVAIVMYNDARRLLLAEYYSLEYTPRSNSSALEIVATFILLNVYGLCSGDFRSYEIGEAFQGSLTTAVTEYAETLSSTLTASEDAFASKLLEALYVLDSYRFVIMLRPPSMMWQEIARCATPDSKLARTFLATTSTVDGDIHVDGPPSTLIALASLAPNLWSALRSFRDLEGGNALTPLGCRLHRQDFVDLAIDKCAQVHDLEHCKSLSDLSLYHAMCIMLHTKFNILQSLMYVNRSFNQSDSAASAGTRSESVKIWLKSRDYQIASWHAQKLLASAERFLLYTQSDFRQQIDALADERHTQHEAPHVSSAIYYAILVLNAKAASGDSESPSSQTRVPILRGERLLSLLRAPIAKFLARVVRDLSDSHIK